MQVIPRVSIYRGQVVFFDGEGYTAADVPPIKLIEKAHKEYGTVLVEDVDAVFGNIPNLDLLRKLEKLEVWVDGGVRFSENVMDVLVAGGSKAVVSSKTLHSFAELDKAMKLTENVVFQMDYCEKVMGNIAVQYPDPLTAVARAGKAGVDTIIFMDNCSPSPLERAESLFPSEVRERLYVGMLSAELVGRESDRIQGAVVDALEVMQRE